MLKAILPLLLLLPLTAGARDAAPEAATFVIIQPGQPGSPAEAQPVVDALAGYLGERLPGAAPMTGRYFNRADEALAYLGEHRPAWGIVSLEFYSRYARRFGLTAVAATRPGGADKEHWRLLAAQGASADWTELAGPVAGTMLAFPRAAACLMWGRPASALPFVLAPTDQPLRQLRQIQRQRQAGIILDSRQYLALAHLPLADGLKVLFQSGDLPTSPVVAFDSGDRLPSGLAAALAEMATDPAAADLLTLLQTEGFAPPDPMLPRLVLSDDDTDCWR